MKTHETLSLFCSAVALMTMVSVSEAVPIHGLFLPDSFNCDGPNLPQQQLAHELGDGPASNPFPIDERIFVSIGSLPVPFAACVQDDGIANDYVVRMINLSQYSYSDLYFVADDVGQVVGNYDGTVLDLSNPTNSMTQAFRIDGTVTLGTNNPLLQEVSGTTNEIFEPGETWEFFVINFTGGVPSFGSAGAFGVGSIPSQFSTASILAIQVPEPGVVVLTVMALAICGRAHRRKK